MRYLILTVLLFAGCQSTRHKNEISFTQFKIYATHELPQAMWSSRARNQALGNPRPRLSVDAPRELFGLNFTEAKDKVVIVDVRPAAEFKANNLTQNKNIKPRVMNIPASTLADIDHGAFNKDDILFVIADTKKMAEESFQTLRRLGYNRSLYFAGDYENLPKMQESSAMPALETQ